MCRLRGALRRLSYLCRPTAAERSATLSDEVWPWLVQLGKRRAGWYFPGWFERLVPRPRRGLRHLDPAYAALEVGDVIPDWGGKDETFTVAGLAAGLRERVSPPGQPSGSRAPGSR